MSLLPAAMKDSDPIPTGLGKKIERSEEKKKAEEDLGNGIYRIDGKLQTRRPLPDLPVPDIVPDALTPLHIQPLIDYCRETYGGVKRVDLMDGWIAHKPGDPMPCDGDVNVVIRLREPEYFEDEACLTDIAKYWEWGAFSDHPDREIIAWRPAC